ncbi:POTRA domain-containing protein [Iodidimonas gelatinilytica]|uniref:POTRA domain-containing protein n=1 Tax=Iodidimonas gelatinilytica TaxID=1236966 RepID=UPI001230A55B
MAFDLACPGACVSVCDWLHRAFDCASSVKAQGSAPFPSGEGRIEGIAVSGIQRIEPATVVSYLSVRVGDPFDPERLDDSLKRLFATGLFADVSFDRNGNTLVIQVTENPIINRIIFDGNKRLDNEELSARCNCARVLFSPVPKCRPTYSACWTFTNGPGALLL